MWPVGVGVKWGLLLSYALLIAYLSVRQASGPEIEHLDKVMHLGAYGLFGILAWWVSETRDRLVYLVLAIVAYGGFLEVVQSYLPARQMSLADGLVNALGAWLGAYGALWLRAMGHSPRGDT